MLHIISSITSPLMPVDLLKQRIEAKVLLWQHFQNIFPELRSVKFSPVEMVEQIATDSIDHLHPVFSGPEIFNEVQTACITFMIPEPDSVQKLFTSIYYRKIVSKIRRDYGKTPKGKKGPEGNY